MECVCVCVLSCRSLQGPFDTVYREVLVGQWLASVKEQGIAFSPGFSFATFLAKPTDVRDWNIQGLPADNFSTENGISYLID